MAGQVYSVNTLGGNMAVPDLTQKLRELAQPMFRLRQFVNFEPVMGAGKGNTWLFDKTGDVATQGGTLVETETIPETNFVSNQGTGTITEYGLAIPYTLKLNKLGQFELPAIVESKLRDDQVKVLESAAGDQFVATEYIASVISTASVDINTSGTATATASADLTAANTRSIVDFMKKNLVPKVDGSRYVCVASVSSLSGMHSDTGSGGWVDVSKYTEGRVSNIFNGEVGEYYNVAFLEDTGYLSNTVGVSSVNGQAVFFGADAVLEGMVTPEEIRVKESNDYGRQLGLAWYAVLGFQLVWDLSVDGQQRVVFVTSA